MKLERVGGKEQGGSSDFAGGLPAERPFARRSWGRLARHAPRKSPNEAVLAGVVASEAILQSRGFARISEAVITTTQELPERELSKLSAIAAALTDLLSHAGVSEPVARMTADAAVTIFVEATRRWQADEDTDFKELVCETAQLLHEATVALARPM